MTLALDILLLTIDKDLRVVRERENTGYAMRAADLIELAIARRVEVHGRGVKWLYVTDPRPVGNPLLDASLASLAVFGHRLMPTDWIARHPGRGVIEEGLALLEAQGAVRRYTRRVSSRLTLVEPALLDLPRQQLVRARLDRFVAAGPAADVLDWALAGLVYRCNLWIPGPVDRAAWRRYKEAALGQRGRSATDPVEASIRILMRDAHNARNHD